MDKKINEKGAALKAALFFTSFSTNLIFILNDLKKISTIKVKRSRKDIFHDRFFKNIRF